MKIKILSILAVVFMAANTFVGAGAVTKNIFGSNSQSPKMDEGQGNINGEMEPMTPADTTGFIEWQRLFDSGYYDSGRCIQQTSDGGYIVVGFGFGFDIWLIKLDSQGNKEWDKTYDKYKLDYGWYVQQTTDGGYIILGETSESGVAVHAWLIKTDDRGNIIWDRLLSKDKFSWGKAVQQTTDGGYIVVGYTTDNLLCPCDIWLLKTDSEGYEEWSRVTNYYNDDEAFSVQQTLDGGYILVGYKEYNLDPLYADIWLIKTDSQGYQVWDRTFGNTNVWNQGNFVRQTSDYGYIIVGNNLFIKTDLNGNEIWRKNIGGQCVQQTKDGGYIIAGYKSTLLGSLDLKLIKTDSQGKKKWYRIYGGPYNDVGNFVLQTEDGGYIVVGAKSFPLIYPATQSDVWIIKTGERPISDVSSIMSITIQVNQQQNSQNSQTLQSFQQRVAR